MSHKKTFEAIEKLLLGLLIVHIYIVIIISLI
jgi:cell division protein FtsL